MEQKEAWEKSFKPDKYKWTVVDIAVENLIRFLKKKRRFDKILDLGCGSGVHILYLAKKNRFVIGSDISSPALSYAKKWLKKERIKNHGLVENSIIELPFLNECFDVVISINTIHHNPLPKIKKTVDEIGRVLKSGGLALVTICSAKDYKFGFGKKLGKNTYLSEKGIVHYFFEEKEAKMLFGKFKIIQMRERVEIKERRNIVHRLLLRKIKAKKLINVHWQILAEKR